MSTDLTTTSKSSSLVANKDVGSRELGTRQGTNDLEIEILRAGVYFDGYLHDVEPGDVFQVTERRSRSGGRWFRCNAPVRRTPGLGVLYERGDQNPVFSFDGMEILQAAPTVARVVPNSLPGPGPAALPSPESSDVFDVEFKEV
jgi:hypothetical protein